MRKDTHRRKNGTHNTVLSCTTLRSCRAIAVVVLLFVLELLAACSSKAKVQWENLDRSAMQDKIASVNNGAENANIYRELTANFTDTERNSLNTLLDIVIDRTPSKADKKATVESILRSLLVITNDTTLRPRLAEALQSLTAYARIFDVSVKSIADGLNATQANTKLSFLSQSENFATAVASDATLVAVTESMLPKLNGETVSAVGFGFEKLTTNTSARNEYLKILFKTAPALSRADLNSLIERAANETIQAKIFQGLNSIAEADEQLGTLARVQNSLPDDELDIFIKITGHYTGTAISGQTKTNFVEALKKALVLKASLRSSFLAEVDTVLGKSDSATWLAALVDSIDRTSGEAFFGLPQFTTKNLRPTLEPTCLLRGASTPDVTYSFRWTIAGTPQATLSSPTNVRQNSAGSLYPQNTQVQCSIRVFVRGSKVTELNTDLVTVRSLPPLFTSGEPPIEDSFSITKGGSFLYVVSARDNVPDLNTFYRMTAQPQHGVVTQTELGTFEYKSLAGYVGSDSFKFAACNLDDICSSDKVVKLTMTDGNKSPKLERMIAPAWNTIAGGLRMSEDATLNDIQLIIDEDNVIDSSCGVPNVIVTSGNTSRFPQSSTNIEVSGTFPYCKLKLRPAIGSAGLGTTTMTLTLDDLVNPPVVSTFNVTVLEKAPQWSASTAATSYTVNKNSGAHTIQLDPASDADLALFSTPQSLSYVITRDANLGESGSPGSMGFISAASAVPAAGSGTLTYTTPTGQPANTAAIQTTSFTYKVCDNASPTPNCSSSKTVNLNIVNNAPTISVISNRTIAEDSDTGTINFTIDDLDDSRVCEDVSVTSGNTALIPASTGTPGITITDVGAFGTNGRNCTVTAAPVANAPGGSATITLSLAHSTTLNRTFTVTVTSLNDAPTLTGGDSTKTTPEDTATTVNLGIGADNDTGDTLSYAIIVPPAHGTLGTISGGPSPTAGTVQYTPSLNFDGTDSFTYTVCDLANLCAAPVNVSISVTASNDPPTITAIPNMVVNQNSNTGAIPFAIADPDDMRLCSNVVVQSADTTLIPDSSGTPGITITDAGASGTTGRNCTATVAPALNSSGGPVTITLRLSHSPLPVERTFSVNVTPVNNPPALSGSTSNLTTAEESTLSISLEAGTDPDSSTTFSYLIITPPTHGTLGTVTSTPSVPYSPHVNFNGSDSFTYKVCDQFNLCSSQTNTVNITVTSVNDAPTRTAGSGDTIVQVSEQGTKDIILASGSDPEGSTLVAKVVSLPWQGTLAGSPAVDSIISSPITYTPALGQLGTFSLTYKLCDTTGSPQECTTNQTVSIEVLSKTPVFNGESTTSIYNIAENASATSILLDGATDPDAHLFNTPQTKTYTLTLTNNLGTLGTTPAVPVSGTASIQFTPNANTSGVEIITYKVCDNAGTPNCTPVKSITINIGTPTYPILTSAGTAPAATPTNTAINFVLGRFIDPTDASASLTYEFTTNPGNRVTSGTLNPKSSTTTDRQVTYTPPDDGVAGTEIFKYRACRTAAPANCSAEYTVTMERTSSYTTPTLTGGDSLVILSETAGVGGGAININLATSTATNALRYTIVSGPQTQSGKARNNNADVGVLTFKGGAITEGVALSGSDALAASASADRTLTYTLNTDVYAGLADQITYKACYVTYPTICSETKSVSIAVIASDDHTTVSSLSLDGGGPPFAFTVANQNAQTFAKTFTLNDSDTTIGCTDLEAISSNTNVFTVGAITGTTTCTFDLSSVTGKSGDSTISIRRTTGAIPLKLNGTNETSFRATALALNVTNQAIHICAGSIQNIANRPAGVNDPIDGAAVCKDYVSSGWDATLALDATKYFRNINAAKLPDPRRYCTGIKLFGYQGMALCGNGTEPLLLHRNVGTLLLSALTVPTADYRLFPDPSKDHDAQTVGGSGVTKATRPTVVCGTGTTIASRIADCATANGANSYWDGSANGNSGQGLWRLVSVKLASGADCTTVGNCTEVWRDERTGLLWSDVIIDGSGTPVSVYNWCKASGSSNATGAPSQEGNATCGNATNQGQDTTGATKPTSLCAEHASFLALDARQQLSRGQLDLASNPVVRWWLPSRSDYLRAERNGLRFVLPNMNNEFWTATVSSATPTNAWTFDGIAGGKLTTAALTATKKVRCVGSP